MTKWEYKVESHWRRTDFENIVEMLRVSGLEGWELISVYDINDRIRHTFKRPLPIEVDAAYLSALLGEHKEAPHV